MNKLSKCLLVGAIIFGVSILIDTWVIALMILKVIPFNYLPRITLVGEVLGFTLMVICGGYLIVTTLIRENNEH